MFPRFPHLALAFRKADAMTHAAFEAAVAHVLRHEGGYVDHPRDPGGATNMGITHITLSEWRGYPVTKADVRALSQKEAKAIYKARYWDLVRGDDLPAGVALAVFDLAVNSGHRRAAKMLQRIAGVTVDGVIGPQTIAAVNTLPSAYVIKRLCADRLTFLQRLRTWSTFGRGWGKRVRDVEAAALEMTPAYWKAQHV